MNLPRRETKQAWEVMLKIILKKIKVCVFECVNKLKG